MEVRHVIALSPYQVLVSHLSRLLYRRNIPVKRLRIEDVLGPCLTNPRTMELADAVWPKTAQWTSEEQYTLFLNVRMNLRFRYHDYFVAQNGVIVMAVAKKEKAREGSDAV